MKKLLFSLIALAVLFTSCMDDDEGVKSYVAWGVSYENADAILGYEVLLGDSTVVRPVSSDFAYEPDGRELMYLKFQLEDGVDISDEELDVHVETWTSYPVNEAIICDSSSLDTLGVDPIGVNTFFQIGETLNFPFSIFVSYSITHDIDLVYYPDSVGVNGEVYLELRHNANDDSNDVIATGCYSCDMMTVESFQSVEDSIPFVVVINPGKFSNATDSISGYYYASKYLK